MQTLHQRAQRVLPAAIQTTALLLQGGADVARAALLPPLRRHRGGALLMRLAEPAAHALRCAPWRFLQGATCARAALSRRGYPQQYHPWRAMRVTAQWIAATCGVPPICQPGYPRVFFTSSIDGRALLVVVADAMCVTYRWRD